MNLSGHAYSDKRRAQGSRMQYHEPSLQSRHNPDNHLPAYARISQSLRRQIESKAWQPGDLIPTESRLSKEYGVSIGTVRKALQELVIAGFLYRVQGKGTYVAGSFIRSKDHRFYRTHAAFGEPDPERRFTFLRSSTEPGQDFICRYLQLEEGTPLLKLERLISIDDRPFVLVHSYFEAARFPELARTDPRRFESEALTLIIEEDYGTPTMSASELCCAATALPEVAAVLQLPENSPVLFLEMLSCSYNEIPYEYRQSFCVPGRRLSRSSCIFSPVLP